MTTDPKELAGRLRELGEVWKRNSFGSDEHLGYFGAQDAALCLEAAAFIEALPAPAGEEEVERVQIVVASELFSVEPDDVKSFVRDNADYTVVADKWAKAERIACAALAAMSPRSAESGPFGIVVKADGVWLNFKTGTGLQASISVASMARERHGIVGMTLRDWAREEIERAALTATDAQS